MDDLQQSIHDFFAEATPAATSADDGSAVVGNDEVSVAESDGGATSTVPAESTVSAQDTPPVGEVSEEEFNLFADTTETDVTPAADADADVTADAEKPSVKDEADPFETAPEQIRQLPDFQKLLANKNAILEEKKAATSRARAWETAAQAVGIASPEQLLSNGQRAPEIFQEVVDPQTQQRGLTAQSWLQESVATDPRKVQVLVNDLFNLPYQGQAVFDVAVATMKASEPERVLRALGLTQPLEFYQNAVAAPGKAAEEVIAELNEVPVEHREAYRQLTLKQRDDYWLEQDDPREVNKLLAQGEAVLFAQRERAAKAEAAVQQEAAREQFLTQARQELAAAQEKAVFTRLEAGHNTLVTSLAAKLAYYQDETASLVQAEQLANLIINLTDPQYQGFAKHSIKAFGLDEAFMQGLAKEAQTWQGHVREAEAHRRDNAQDLQQKAERAANTSFSKLQGFMNKIALRDAKVKGVGLRQQVTAQGKQLEAARSRPALQHGRASNGKSAGIVDFEALRARIQGG